MTTSQKTQKKTSGSSKKTKATKKIIPQKPKKQTVLVHSKLSADSSAAQEMKKSDTLDTAKDVVAYSTLSSDTPSPDTSIDPND
jgi:hypothetical protein